MKLLFVTDLHGDSRKYERALEVALASGVEVVINGGDMLPKGGASRQAEFITGYLEPYFARYDASGIYHLGFLGNDDLRIYDQLFERICLRFPRVEPLAQRRLEIGGYQWVGFNWVPDFPFRLKDRARKDSQSFSFPRQFGTALLSAPQGMQEIPDWFAYAGTLPTVAEELRRLERPTHMARAVYVIHTPPSGLGLDVTATGERVGSTAVYDFLRANQPMLSLHGHIHESPRVSGRWQAWLGKTLCIQPGQLQPFTYVLGDLETMRFERVEEEVL